MTTFAEVLDTEFDLLMDEAYVHVGNCPRQVGRRCDWHETRWRPFWDALGQERFRLPVRSWMFPPVLTPRNFVTITGV